MSRDEKITELELLTPELTTEAKQHRNSNQDSSLNRVKWLSKIYKRQTNIAENSKQKRLVLKDGHSNLSHSHIKQRRRMFAQDAITTLMEMSLWYNFFMFVFGFFVSWTLFGLVWWAISAGHRDHLKPDDDPSVRKCLYYVNDFANALIFSVETQTTIGYGTRMMDLYCSETIFVLMVQLVVGVFVEAFVTGMIFEKLSRRRKRTRAVRFSHHAVVCRRNGRRCLLFRVWNTQPSSLVGASIRAVLLERSGSDGATKADQKSSFPVTTEAGDGSPFFLPAWPMTFMHEIGAKSPLHLLTADTLKTIQFEIIVILEGTVESTGNTTQFATSFINTEIYWDHRLVPLTVTWTDDHQMKIACSNFDAIEPVHTNDDDALDEQNNVETNITDGGCP